MTRITSVVVAGGVLLAVAVLSIVLLANPFGPRRAQPPLPPQAVQNPVPGLPADPNLALATVVAKIDFTLKLPTYFPTAADHLQWANYGFHSGRDPQPNPLPDVMYMGPGTVTVDGQEIRPSLEIRYSGGSHDVLSPIGDIVSEDFADFILYKAVNSKAADGTPVQVTYSAIHSPVSISLVFTAEQPSMLELEKMLKSFVPVTIAATSTSE